MELLPTRTSRTVATSDGVGWGGEATGGVERARDRMSAASRNGGAGARLDHPGDRARPRDQVAWGRPSRSRGGPSWAARRSSAPETGPDATDPVSRPTYVGRSGWVDGSH